MSLVRLDWESGLRFIYVRGWGSDVELEGLFGGFRYRVRFILGLGRFRMFS